MNQKELTKTFIMISNQINPWSPWLIRKYFSTIRIKGLIPGVCCAEGNLALLPSRDLIILMDEIYNLLLWMNMISK